MTNDTFNYCGETFNVLCLDCDMFENAITETVENSFKSWNFYHNDTKMILKHTYTSTRTGNTVYAYELLNYLKDKLLSSTTFMSENSCEDPFNLIESYLKRNNAE